MLLESTPTRENLTEAELRILAEVVTEMARALSSPFSTQARAQTLARAARNNAAFKASIVALHRNIIVRRKTDPNHMLAPLTPLFYKLELEAHKVLNRSQ